jgi:hypothetical protein
MEACLSQIGSQRHYAYKTPIELNVYITCSLRFTVAPRAAAYSEHRQ